MEELVLNGEYNELLKAGCHVMENPVAGEEIFHDPLAEKMKVS